MDSRCSLPSNALVGGGNAISVCERESNFVSRCVRSRIDPQQSPRQLLEQGFRLFEILSVEALGEPVKDRLQQITSSHLP